MSVVPPVVLALLVELETLDDETQAAVGNVIADLCANGAPPIDAQGWARLRAALARYPALQAQLDVGLAPPN